MINKKKLLGNPQSVPIVQVDTDLPVLHSDSLSESFLRTHFQNPPAKWYCEDYPVVQLDPGKAMRQAAVLVPIVQTPSSLSIEPELSVLLTRRSAHLRDHAGQISFPGGKVDPSDDTPIVAALRETHEEVGIAPSYVDVLGILPKYRTGTAYDMTPVVGMLKGQPQLKLGENEVTQTFTVPLSFILNPANHRWHEQVLQASDGSGGTWRWLSMEYVYGSERYFIWGATAAILRSLYWFLRAAE